jgi:hypothetical protein
MKLRRNPTPPPSLGGYEPLEYDDDDEDEDEEEESSPVSQCTCRAPSIENNVLTDRFSY